MKFNSHSAEIEERLGRVRMNIRNVQRARGIMLVCTVAIGGLLALMAVDVMSSPLPLAVRWGLFGIWTLSVLFAAKTGFSPLFKRISLLQVARWLEGRHPEMEERLSTVLELATNDQGVSAELLESLGRAAQADASSVDATLEVKGARSNRRWTRPATTLGVMMVTVFAIWPGEASRLLIRALAPFSTVGSANAGKFKISPGNLEVLEGDAVRIEVSYEGKNPNLEIWMDFESGSRVSQQMVPYGNSHIYEMNPVRAGFRYHVRAGREQSNAFQVTVWPTPHLLEPEGMLHFPTYTGQQPLDVDLAQGVDAVTGTRVAISGKINTAIDAAWVEIGGSRVAEGVVENGASSGRVNFEWNLETAMTGTATIRFKHRLGREIDAFEFPVNVLGDSAPVITLLSPMQREIKIRKDESLTLKYEIEEDFSVAKLAVEVDAGGRPPVQIGGLIPSAVKSSMPQLFRGQEEVLIGELIGRFPGINDFRLRILAEDGRPADLGGPGVGHSEWIILHLDQNAESLARQELRNQDEVAKKTVEDAIRATREGREKMEQQRGEIRKPELSDQAKKELQKSAEQLAVAETQLEELAKKLEESVHSSKSDQVKQAAELAEKAREELENSLLQDDPAQRESRLDQARNNAQENEKLLEEIRNAMDRDRGKIEDLARLMELAQKQQEIARQAAVNSKEADLSKAIPDDWKNQQRQVAEELKQQLRERPEGKTEALTSQAEQARELAEQSRDMAKSQDEMRQQLDNVSPEKLKEALAEEQAAIAKETREELAQAQNERNAVSDTLPEATSATETALEQLTNGDAASAADSAKVAAEALKTAANQASAEPATTEASFAAELQAQSLTKLAARQEQVAKNLTDLAQGKSAEVTKALQEAQATMAGEIAKSIANMPQLDQNGAVQEAKNSGQQGSEQAKAAVEKNQQGQAGEAAAQHSQASQNFEKSAQALDRAAEEFSRAAQESTAQQSNPERAQISPQALAQAFEESSNAAASSQPFEAASQAASAAESLAVAAESGRQSMQGKGGDKGNPPKPGAPPGNVAGMKSEEGPREAEADQGIPPELAKLGINSDDWAKIKASLKSDVGATEGGAVPEEYRGLVKGYFETMSGKSTKR